MKTSTKIQQVPTVLLDSVLAISLKKYTKTPIKSVVKNVNSSKVVMYKMISTEEWQKKEALRIARDIELKAKREKPLQTKEEKNKKCNAWNNEIMPSGLIRRKEYYQKNKQRIKQHNKEYCKKNKEQVKLRSKEYYKKNQERLKQYNKEYYIKHKNQK